MRVVKHGRTKEQFAECPVCGCKYAFTEEDLVHIPLFKRCYVNCPECGTEKMFDLDSIIEKFHVTEQ